MSDAEAEVFRALREAQNRYTYFLLFAVGGAIALCVNQTRDASLGWSQVPLAVAVLCWGTSFFFGCRHLVYVQSCLFANMAVLGVEKGEHPDVGSNPQMIAAVAARIGPAIEKNSDRANRFGHWQFRLLVAGAVFYLAWHVGEMCSRGVA